MSVARDDTASAVHRSSKNAYVDDTEKHLKVNEHVGEVVQFASGPLDAIYGVGGVGRTQRRLKSRHVTFIGFGGGIGTGLFIGTGAALANAGPLGLLLAFTIVGGILWCVMESIGELATLVSNVIFHNIRDITGTLLMGFLEVIFFVLLLFPLHIGHNFTHGSFPRPVLFPISLPALLTLHWDLLWLSHMATVTLSPSRPRFPQLRSS